MNIRKLTSKKLHRIASSYAHSHLIECPVVANGEIAKNEKSFSDDVEWNLAVPYQMVPGPKPLPLLGNNWRFIPFIGDFQIEHIDKVSKRLYQKYGKIVKMEGLLGRPDMLFLFDPNDIEKVFRQEDLMPLRPSMPSLNYYKHVYRKEFFNDNAGVIAVHGEDWQNFRSKVNQIMLQPRSAKLYMEPIKSTADSLIRRIRKIRDEKEEVPEDFLNELHKWSLESIARVALDVPLGCLEENADPETQKLIDAVQTFFINVPVLELKIPFWRLFNTPTFRKYIDALDTITRTTMHHISRALENLEKAKNHGQHSVLQKVILENDPKTATVLALDMFLVGIDTTSNALASILYQLAIHQDKQKILREEISRLLSSQNTTTTFTNAKLEQMTYLRACIKETMRMFPVVIGNGRCTTKDCVIGGYQIPKGVQVVFQHYVVSNLDEFFPKSSEFLPERWLKSSKNVKSANENHHPFASLPFGYGRRMCLGRRFAELELQVAVAKIIQNFHIEYNYEKLDYHIHPMYTPNGPLKLKFVDR